MRIAVFGASGATGGELVAQALSQGHSITALLRDPDRLNIRSIDVRAVQGDVANNDAVELTIHGQNAVLCALGAATPLRRDPTLVLGIQHIVNAMRQMRTRRLVYMSFLGVRDGRLQLSLIGRMIVAPFMLRNVVADHEAKERINQDSELDWIIVRPPRLTNGPRRGRYRHGLDIRAASVIPSISRA